MSADVDAFPASSRCDREGPGANGPPAGNLRADAAEGVRGTDGDRAGDAVPQGAAPRRGVRRRLDAVRVRGAGEAEPEEWQPELPRPLGPRPCGGAPSLSELAGHGGSCAGPVRADEDPPRLDP